MKIRWVSCKSSKFKKDALYFLTGGTTDEDADHLLLLNGFDRERPHLKRHRRSEPEKTHCCHLYINNNNRFAIVHQAPSLSVLDFGDLKCQKFFKPDTYQHEWSWAEFTGWGNKMVSWVIGVSSEKEDVTDPHPNIIQALS